MLGMTDSKFLLAKKYHMAPYYQILGFRRDSSSLIGAIKKKQVSPMVRHLRPLHDPLEKATNSVVS